MLSLQQHVDPDRVEVFRIGGLAINETLVFSWIVMAALIGGSWLVTRSLRTGRHPSRGQALLEMVVGFTQGQIREVLRRDPRPLLPFVGTLFLFILLSNLLLIVPGFTAPTASLSTTTALALCVFVAVPAYGIVLEGPRAYLAHYVKPNPLMLPFHVIGELSRTLAMAVRLFGNVMSGVRIAALLLAIAPLLFPVVMQLLGLLTGVIQAYIFAVLAMIYIASGIRAGRGDDGAGDGERREGGADDGGREAAQGA